MRTSQLGVIGAGYVGLTTAAGFAKLGYQVDVVDIDEARVRQLNQGVITLREPGMAELVAQGLSAGRLRFSTGITALRGADVVFVCVPTPMTPGGEADLSAVRAAVTAVGQALRPGAVIVLKSTVPVGTARQVAALVAADQLQVVSNPEFLRESHAVQDFLHADRIVIGGDSGPVGQVAALYDQADCPIQRMDWESAELAKYASNAFLAVKLSFVNELAQLCGQVGADIAQVSATMGADPRIGAEFLQPGPGWGGSCLPKDTAALLHTARQAHSPLRVVDAAVRANAAQAALVAAKATAAAGGSLAGLRAGLLGLTFKAGTADLRDSPALAIAQALIQAGAQVTAYDPAVLPEDVAHCEALRSVQVASDPLLAGKDAAVLVVATEWPAFTTLDWPGLGRVMRHKAVVDTRGIIDHAALRRAGFTVTANGSGAAR